MVFFILIVGFICTTASCFQDKSTPPRICTNIWPGYELLYLARPKNHFHAEHAQLVELLSANDVMKALTLRPIDVAALTLEQVLTFRSHGTELTVIFILDVLNDGDAFVAKPYIQTLQDIKGKTITYEKFAVGAVMMDGILKSAGLLTNDVNLQHFPINEHEHASANHAFNAVVTFEPVTSRLLLRHGHIIFDSRQTPARIVDVFVAHTDLIQNNKSKLQHIVQAQLFALEFFNRHPHEATEMMAPRSGLTPESLLHAYDGLSLSGKHENLRLMANHPAPIHQTAESLNQLLLAFKLISAPADSKHLFNPKFVLQSSAS